MPESDVGDTAARDNIRRRIAEESQEMTSDNAADTDDKTDNDTPDNSDQ